MAKQNKLGESSKVCHEKIFAAACLSHGLQISVKEICCKGLQFSLFMHPDQAQNTSSGIQGQEATAVAVIYVTAPT